MIPRVVAIVVACLLGFSAPASAQSGRLYGKVLDSQSGEELIGANVLLVGTTIGAATDIDGKYSIEPIPVGTYSVRFSFVGYAPKTVSGVSIQQDEPFKLDVSLDPESFTTEEVVVTAEREVATESAVLALRKKSSTIGDGFSAEQVKQTGDATAGDALKRVTGITVVDNKFVFVRGVTDRYNATMLNGIPITSTDTEVDKRSFTYDILPANLIENTIVTKTATPDLPGDFTGGMVQLTTKEFPDERSIRMGLSLKYNTISSLTTLNMTQGGGSDWVGFDDGSRDFIEGKSTPYELPRALPNTWAQRSARSPVNYAISLSYGDKLLLGDNTPFGYLASLSYRADHKRTEISADNILDDSPLYRGTRDRYAVLWSGILDLNLKLGGLHKFAFKNNYSQSGSDEAFVSKQFVEDIRIPDTPSDIRTRVSEWNQRGLYVGQLAGEHVFPGLADLDVHWQASYSATTSEAPDRRTDIYNRFPSDPLPPYVFTFADRSWAKLYEDTKRGAIDITKPIEDLKLKFGAVAEYKRRDYGIKFYQNELEFGGGEFDLLYLPIDSIFLAENFRVGGYRMLPFTDARDKYDGSHTLFAGYAMVDLPFSVLDQTFRLVGGARLENSKTLVNTIDPFQSNAPFTARVENVDVLPSLNFTYLFNPVTNLRFAYYQTVNRPEFRELANFYFYDYFTYEGRFGNPLLRRALAKNWDVRLEFFPDVGEVVAVSYFYKNITDAIEEQLVITSVPERTWFNSPKAINRGWEVEFRKGFGFVTDYLRNLVAVVNYTRVESEVEYFLGQEIATRPMQGQSPWTWNFSLQFREPSLGTTVSVFYNAFATRLNAVGKRPPLDIFELDDDQLDLSVLQSLGPMIEARLVLQNLTNSRTTFTYRTGEQYRVEYGGRTYSLALSLSF